MARSSTVMVVDDDEVSRTLLHDLLKEEEYTVVLARSGAEALALAARAPLDVVLLDVLMPDMDGFEVCRRLRSNAALRHLPIVLITALEGRSSRLQGLEAGADEFLIKPVDLVELRTRLRTITSLNRYRQLCDERARFESAVAHSPDAIALTDSQGSLLHANAAFQRLIGRTPPRIFDCFPAEISAAIAAQLLARDEIGPQVNSLETILALCATPGACAEVTVVHLPGSDQPLFEFILRDVTERRQLEAQLMRLQRIELLGQLASGVVHDVNNLLLAVMLNAELLRNGAPAETLKRVEVICHSAECGSALLRQILMFARGSDQTMKALHVPPLLHETATIVAKLLSRQIEFAVETPAHLPAIIGDPSQLHQVVINLCVNARDAMPHAGKMVLMAEAVQLDPPAARAIAPDATSGEFVVVRVIDHGTGIPLEIRPRLFDPFFTTKPRETATGLGLATVLRIMRRHHGFIGVESEVGRGSCFSCFFPVQPKKAPGA